MSWWRSCIQARELNSVPTSRCKSERGSWRWAVYDGDGLEDLWKMMCGVLSWELEHHFSRCCPGAVTSTRKHTLMWDPRAAVTGRSSPIWLAQSCHQLLQSRLEYPSNSRPSVVSLICQTTAMAPIYILPQLNPFS